MNKAELKQMIITLTTRRNDAGDKLRAYVAPHRIEMGLVDPEVKNSETYKELDNAYKSAQNNINYLSRLLPKEYKEVIRGIALEKRAVRFGLVK